MSQYKRCPHCHYEAKHGVFGGAVMIYLHKCRTGGHLFCNECKNGNRCPVCGSSDVWWNYDQAYTDK